MLTPLLGPGGNLNILKWRLAQYLWSITCSIPGHPDVPRKEKPFTMTKMTSQVVSTRIIKYIMSFPFSDVLLQLLEVSTVANLFVLENI